MPTCFVTGQAAGVAASLAVKQGKENRTIAVEDVQQILRKQGAILD